MIEAGSHEARYGPQRCGPSIHGGGARMPDRTDIDEPHECSDVDASDS